MILSNESLLELLAKNPKIEIIDSGAKLWLSDGQTKVQFEYNPVMQQDLMKNVPHRKFQKMEPLEIGQSRMLTWPNAAFEYVSDSFKPKKPKKHLTKNQKQKQARTEMYVKEQGSRPITSYTAKELTGIGPDTIVNDFLTKYYSGTGQYSKKDIQRAWTQYSSKYKIPVTQASAAKSTLKKILETMSTVADNSDNRVIKSLRGGGKVKTLKAPVQLLENYGNSKPLTMRQKILDVGNRYVVFSGTEMDGGQSKDPRVANAFGTMLQERFHVSDKPISLITPSGVTNIIPKKDQVMVDGFSTAKIRIPSEEILHRYNELPKGQQRVVTLASEHAAYVRKQGKLEPRARQVVSEIMSGSASTMEQAEVETFMKEHTVKDLKRLAKGLNLDSGTTKQLLKFEGADNKSIMSFLDEGDLVAETIKPAKNFKERLLEENIAKKAKVVMGNARSLNIDPESVWNDIDSIGGDDSLKRLKAFQQIESTLGYTLKDPVRARKARIQNLKRSFVGDKGPEPIDYKMIVENFKETGNLDLLRAKGFLSPGNENPLLNLEGRVEHKHVQRIIDAMLVDAKVGNLRDIKFGTKFGSNQVYNPEALIEFGRLLSDSSLRTVEKQFKSSLGARSFLYQARRGGIGEVLKTFNLIEDVETSAQNSFGGKTGIDDIKRGIKRSKSGPLGYLNQRERDRYADYTLKDFSGAGETKLPEDYSELEINSKYKQLMADRDEQVQSIKNFDTKSGKGKDGFDPREAYADNPLYKDSPADLMDKALGQRNNLGVGIETTNLKDLGEQVQKYKEMFKKKSPGETRLDLTAYTEMLQLAKAHGLDSAKVKGKPVDSLKPRSVFEYLNGYYESKFAEAYPGLTSINDRVKVNLTTALFRDLARQTETSSKAVGAQKLPGATKYMSEREADWAPLTKFFHTDDVGKYSIIFDDKKKIAAKKQSILESLGRIIGERKGTVTQAQYDQLSKIYGASKLMTGQDEQAFNLLSNNQETHPITGKKTISPRVNRRTLIENLLAPYNLEAAISTPGEGVFAGKKDFISPTKTFGATFDTRTNKLHTKSDLKRARASAAFDYLKSNKKVKEFQNRGGQTAVPLRDLSLTLMGADSRAQAFVNSHVSAIYGSNKNKQKLSLDAVSQKISEKLFTVEGLAAQAADKGKWQTYNAYTEAAEKLKRAFNSREFTKTSTEFAQDLIVDPDKALNKIIAKATRKKLAKEALSMVEAKEFQEGKSILPVDGKPYSQWSLKLQATQAEKMKEQILGLEKLGYHRPVADLKQWLENKGWAKNTDPQEKALSKAGKTIKDSEANILFGREDPWDGERSGGKKARDAKYAKNYNLADSFKFKSGLDNSQERMAYWIRSNLHKKYVPNKKAGFSTDFNTVQRAEDINSIIPTNWKDYLKTLKGFKTANNTKNYASFNLRNFRGLRLAKGGKIPGKGVKDEVPALLMKGETVVDRATSERLGIHDQHDYDRFKKAVKTGKVKGLAGGAWIDDSVNFIDGPEYGEPNRYTERKAPSNKNSIDKAGWNRLETQRTIQNVIIDLADAKNVNINFEGKSNKALNKMLLEGGDAFGSRLNQDTFDKARGGLLNRNIGSLDLTPSELKDLRLVGSEASPMKTKDLSQNTINKLTNLAENDFAGFEKTIKSLADMKTDDAKELRKGITSAIKAGNSPKGLTKLDGFQKAVIRVSEYSKTLGEVLELDQSNFKHLDKKAPKQVIAQITSAVNSIDFNRLKVPTAHLSTSQLKTRENALGTLDKLLGNDAFVRMGEQRSGLQDTRAKVNRARNLKESAESRVSNFGALMAQNSAFMGSYAVIGGVQQAIGSTVKFFGEFDNAMKNIQAITGDTADGLNVMSRAVKQVSTETKFSALEIADAATILGQAGFSAVDVSKSLEGVVQLATATGSKLSDSTQVLTSTLTIWDKSITDSKKYANQFTAAINQSKLDIESLTGAIQYTGNIAAAANIPIADVLTMTSLLKDAGIKRSSTLGTGQRLLYGDFAAPSKKFIASLNAVGVSLEQFSVAFEERGVLGAMKLMKSSGYGLAQASRGMEVREKAIYAAASNQLDKFDPFRSEITGTDAAYLANKTQMEGIGNKFQNMLNSWQINLNTSLDDSREGTRKVLDYLTIDIKKKKPSETTGVKGYKLEDNYKSTRDDYPGVAGFAGLGGLGLGAYSWAMPYAKGQLAVSRKNIGLQKAAWSTSNNNSFLARPGGESTLKSIDKMASRGDYAKVARAERFAGVGKYLGKAAGAGAIGVGAGVGALMAPEGKKGAAFANDLVTGAALLAGGAIIDNMSSQLKRVGMDKYAPRTSGMRGAMNKFGAAYAIMQLDNYFLKPGREKGETGIAGYLTAGAAGAAGGAYMAAGTGNPWITAGGALAGAVTAMGSAYIAQVEAPKLDLTKAISMLVNDSKALASEIGAISKTAKSFSSLSNYALRPSEDAGDSEKLAKFRAVVTESSNLNDQVKSLEASVASYSKSFSGFNFGKLLSTTKESDVLKNNFKVQMFEAKGTDVVPVIDPSKDSEPNFKGAAADAMTASFTSAVEASFKAMNAKGGVNEGMFNQIKDKDLSKFTKKLEDIDKEKSFAEFKALITGEGVNPIFDLAKTAPVTFLANSSQLKGALEDVFFEARKVLHKQYEDTPVDSVERQDARDKISKLRTYKKNTFARFDNTTDFAGYNASSPGQAKAISVEQVKLLKADNPKLGTEALITKYLESTAGKVTKESYKHLVKSFTPVNQMINKVTDGLNRLHKVDTAGVNLMRKLSIAGAKTLRTDILNSGSTTALGTVELSKELATTLNSLEKVIRPVITRGGKDLKGVPTEAALRRDPKLSVVDRTTLSKYVKQDIYKEGEAEKINKQTAELKKLFGTKTFKALPKREQDIVTDYASREKQLSEKDLVVNTKGAVSINNLSNKDVKNELLEASKGILRSYLKAEKISGKAFSKLNSFSSMSDAKASGDVTLYKMFKQLSISVNKAGIKDIQAYKALTKMTQYKKRAPGEAEKYMSPRQLRSFDIRKSQSLENLALQTSQTLAKINRSADFQRTELGIQAKDRKNQLRRQNDKKVKDIGINKQRSITDLGVRVATQIDNAFIRSDRQKEALGRQYKRQTRDIDTSYSRGVEDLKTKKERGYEDLAKSFSRGMEDLNLKFARGLESIAINQARAYDDLYKNTARAYSDLRLKGARGTEDINIWAERAKTALALNSSDARSDLAKKGLRGTEDIALSGKRGAEDIATKQARGAVKIALNQARSLQDLDTNKARGYDSLALNVSRKVEDANRKKARALEDVDLSLKSNLDKLSRNLERTIAALERSRQDTIAAFERSLTRPQVIVINPKNLGLIANELGSVSLALDAHKAALTANTTAVMQNNALQQTQEDIVKGGYKEAYKKVGGQVYNDDGTVNDAFIKAYDDYMNKNSDGLIDAVLENALNSAYSGTGFNISSALTDAGYIAGQVAAPMPGVTTAAAVAGTGMSADELATTLYGVKADEVRVTTTAGVILEAQGGMPGALFDLETAMIAIDIRIREAGIAFKENTLEATTGLNDALKNIEISFQRNLEDIAIANKRGAEDIEISFAKSLEDISLATSRAFEDLATSVKYSFADLNLRLKRAGEDLSLNIKRSSEDLDTNLARAGRDLALRIAQSGEDLALQLARGAEDIARSFARGMEDIAINSARAGADLRRSINQAAEDLRLKTKRAAEDLEEAIKRGTQDLDKGTDRALSDAALKFADAIEESRLSLQNVLIDIAENAKTNSDNLQLVFDRIFTTTAENFKFTMTEFNKGIEQAGKKLERQIDYNSDEALQSEADAKARLDLSIQQMKDNTLDSMIEWSANMQTSLQTGLDKITWDSTLLKANLELSFQTALQQLKVDGSEIVRAVGASFKAAFHSDKMKQIQTELGEDVVKIIKGGFTLLDQPIKETMDALGKALDKNFKDTLGKALVDAGVVVKKSTKELVKALEGTKVVATTVDGVSKDINKSNDNFKTSGENLIETTLTVNTAAKGLNSSTSDLAETTGSLAIVGTAMAITAPYLKEGAEKTTKAAVKTAEAGGALFVASGKVAGGAAALFGVSSAIPAVGIAIEEAARAAIASINEAVRLAQVASSNASNSSNNSSNPVTLSTGGFLGGYGGGDIIPTMLEPGEFVIRKEIVRQLGVDKLVEVNGGGDKFETIEKTTTVGLPIASSGGISVQIGVQAASSIETIENNIERIADGVRKVFEEYN